MGIPVYRRWHCTRPIAARAFQLIGSVSIALVNLPVGLLVWVMIIPTLMKVDFGALGPIRRHVKGIGVTLFVNWLVKPFFDGALGLDFHSASVCIAAAA